MMSDNTYLPIFRISHDNFTTFVVVVLNTHLSHVFWTFNAQRFIYFILLKYRQRCLQKLYAEAWRLHSHSFKHIPRKLIETNVRSYFFTLKIRQNYTFFVFGLLHSLFDCSYHKFRSYQPNLHCIDFVSVIS